MSSSNDEDIQSLLQEIEALKSQVARLEVENRGVAEANIRAATLMSELQEAQEELEKKTEAIQASEEKLSRMVEDLQCAKQLAEAANEAKTLFLANISHELRTPLHGILSYISFALKKVNQNRTDKLTHYLGKIEESGETLLLLLNDLLDLAKLEAGMMEYNFQRTNLSTLIKSVLDELEPLMSEKDLSLHLQGLDEAYSVYVDPIRIMQTIRNLLSNAIKFSGEAGKVTVQAEHQGNFIVTSVSDEGVGIPEEELKRVFDKFIQSSQTKTKAGGTGLGLAICNEIVSAHEGEIWAENNPESGACFRFTLPECQ